MTNSVRVTYTSFDERRHEFRQADGGWRMCGGLGLCRECNREAERRITRGGLLER